MHKIPNVEACEPHIEAGARAFAEGRGISRGAARGGRWSGGRRCFPLPPLRGRVGVGGDSPALEGWCQASLHTIAGVRNKADDMLQARIAARFAQGGAPASVLFDDASPVAAFNSWLHPALPHTEARFRWGLARAEAIRRIDRRFRVVEDRDIARQCGPAAAVAAAMHELMTMGGVSARIGARGAGEARRHGFQRYRLSPDFARLRLRSGNR